MKKIIMCVAAFGLLSPAAWAEEEPKAEVVSPSPVSTFPKLATLTESGEKLESGDLLSITRPFAGWVLKCDYRLSVNKRLCAIEQTLSSGQSSVVWRIANGVDDRTVLVLSVDPRFAVEKGMRLGFSGLEKTIQKDEWLCTPTACLTGFLFEGFLGSAIASAQNVHFGYSVKAEDGKLVDMSLVGTMEGFSDALKAGSTDPFGKFVVAKSAEPASKMPAKAEPASAPEPEKKPEKKAEAPVQAKPEKVADAKPSPKRRQHQERQPERSKLY